MRRDSIQPGPGPMQGFTLVELLIVVAIVAVLARVAAPSYMGTITNYRISTEVNSLVGDLQYARSEAIKQGLTVQMCTSTDSQTCSTSSINWGSGYIVVAAPFGSNCSQGGGNNGCTTLRVQRAFTGSDTAEDLANQTASVAFNREGFAGTASTTNWSGFAPLQQSLYLTVHASADFGIGSCVYVNPVGQMSVVTRGKTAQGATSACS